MRRASKRLSVFTPALCFAAALLAACSVGDLSFVPDADFNAALKPGAGGMPDNTSGSGNNGDAGAGGDVGGSSSKAGSTSTGGGTTGGSASTGGKPTGGSAPTGGVATGGNMPVGGGPSGGNNTGGSGNVTCPYAKSNPMAPLIDDFDDGNPMLPMSGGRAGGWYIMNDGSATGMQVPSPDPMLPPLPEKPDLHGTGYAMHTRGSGFSQWGAGFGTGLLSVPAEPHCPYDVSPQKGVRFWIKGSVSGGKLRFQVPTMESHGPMQGGTCQGMDCEDHYGYDISPVPLEWTQVSVGFADLTQVGFGKVVPFRPEHVLSIEFQTTAGAVFDFWVDQVEFF